MDPVIAQRRTARGALVCSAASAVVFVAIGVLAALRPLPRWDHDAVRGALPWGRHGDLPLRAVMQFGTTAVAVVLAVLVGVLTRSLRRSLAVVLAAYAGLWTSTLAKHIWARPRPATAFRDIVPSIFASGYGFPSGHATVAGAVAVALAAATRPRWWPLFVVLAGSTALARVAFGVHFVIDVGGGLALGGAAGGVAVWAVQRSIGWRK